MVRKKGNAAIMQLLFAMGGGVAAGFASKALSGMDNLDPKIRAVLPIVAGFFISKQGGNMNSLGLGMAAASAPMLMTAFGVPGIGAAATSDDVDEFEAMFSNIQGANEDLMGAYDSPLAGDYGVDMDSDEDF